MPGENAKWDIGFWDVAKWDTVYAQFEPVPEDAYRAFMRRFYSDHKVALTALAELLTYRRETA